MTKLLGVAENSIREMPRSMAGASAILNKGFMAFLSPFKRIPGGGNTVQTATALLQVLNNSSFMKHELIATDVSFGMSHRVAAVTGHHGGCRLSM
jgi:hypothetical protein